MSYEPTHADLARQSQAHYLEHRAQVRLRGDTYSPANVLYELVLPPPTLPSTPAYERWSAVVRTVAHINNDITLTPENPQTLRWFFVATRQHLVDRPISTLVSLKLRSEDRPRNPLVNLVMLAYGLTVLDVPSDYNATELYNLPDFGFKETWSLSSEHETTPYMEEMSGSAHDWVWLRNKTTNVAFAAPAQFNIIDVGGMKTMRDQIRTIINAYGDDPAVVIDDYLYDTLRLKRGEAAVKKERYRPLKDPDDPELRGFTASRSAVYKLTMPPPAPPSPDADPAFISERERSWRWLLNEWRICRRAEESEFMADIDPLDMGIHFHKDLVLYFLAPNNYVGRIISTLHALVGEHLTNNLIRIHGIGGYAMPEDEVTDLTPRRFLNPTMEDVMHKDGTEFWRRHTSTSPHFLPPAKVEELGAGSKLEIRDLRRELTRLHNDLMIEKKDFNVLVDKQLLVNYKNFQLPEHVVHPLYYAQATQRHRR